jgi:hypothetical protein
LFPTRLNRIDRKANSWHFVWTIARVDAYASVPKSSAFLAENQAQLMGKIPRKLGKGQEKVAKFSFVAKPTSLRSRTN